MTWSSFIRLRLPAYRVFRLTRRIRLTKAFQKLAKCRGMTLCRFAAHVLMGQTESILQSLPDVVHKSGVDALLIDTVQIYAELGAMQLGMPYLHVANAIHFDYSGYTPLCLYGRPHQTTPEALARNREDVGEVC